MSVKRISIGSGTTVCYADDGQAVAYEDYAALEKLCKQQHEALDRMDTEMIYIHEIAADDRSYADPDMMPRGSRRKLQTR